MLDQSSPDFVAEGDTDLDGELELGCWNRSHSLSKNANGTGRNLFRDTGALRPTRTGAAALAHKNRGRVPSNATPETI